MESQFTEYTANHYKHGVCAVFGQSRNDSISLVACIEDHQFQPKNYWYGSILFSLITREHFKIGPSVGMVVGGLNGVQLCLGVLENFKAP